MIELISKELALMGYENVRLDQDLLDDGPLDSLAYLDLVVRIEEATGVRIEWVSVDLDSATTVQGLAKLFESACR